MIEISKNLLRGNKSLRPEAMKQDAEEFFRDFRRNFQEQKAKQAKSTAKPKYENPNPFSEGDGDVLVATENSDGLWEVSER